MASCDGSELHLQILIVRLRSGPVLALFQADQSLCAQLRPQDLRRLSIDVELIFLDVNVIIFNILCFLTFM